MVRGGAAGPSVCQRLSYLGQLVGVHARMMLPKWPSVYARMFDQLSVYISLSLSLSQSIN